MDCEFHVPELDGSGYAEVGGLKVQTARTGGNLINAGTLPPRPRPGTVEKSPARDRRPWSPDRTGIQDGHPSSPHCRCERLPCAFSFPVSEISMRDPSEYAGSASGTVDPDVQSTVGNAHPDASLRLSLFRNAARIRSQKQIRRKCRQGRFRNSTEPDFPKCAGSIRRSAAFGGIE